MIREKLDSLNPEQMRQLQYAFEQQFSQFIELPDSKFIGVNCDPVRHLEPLEKAGSWSYGNIKR